MNKINKQRKQPQTFASAVGHNPAHVPGAEGPATLGLVAEVVLVVLVVDLNLRCEIIRNNDRI